jgi:hypothetical protein
MRRLDELEAAIQSPNLNGSLVKAEMLAVHIARNAPTGPIANLAMQVMSAAIQIRKGTARDANDSLAKTLPELRSAIEAAQKTR